MRNRNIAEYQKPCIEVSVKRKFTVASFSLAKLKVTGIGKYNFFFYCGLILHLVQIGRLFPTRTEQ